MGLSFLFPYFLATGVLLPLLALAYRNQEKRTLKRVTSLVILRKLPKRNLSLRRFKPPLRFFLELLALFLILLGAAGLSVKFSSGKKLLLVDNSLSMSTISVNASGPESRIEEAKKKIRESLASSAGDFDIFVTSPILTRINRTVGGNLEDTLAKITVFPTTDDIESRLLEAVSKFGYSEGIVVTDKRVERASPKFQSIKVGRLAENIFLAEYQWLNDQTLRVRVGHSGPSNVLAKVQLSSLTPTNQFNSSSNVYLNGDTTKDLDFKVSFKKGDRIRVAVESAAASIAEDSIKGDNQLEFKYESGSGTNVLVVSNETDLKARSKLTRIPAWIFTFIQFSDYAKLSKEELGTYAIQFFYKTAPESAPDGSALYVLPPADNNIFPVVTELARQQVTSWQDNHPLNSYLRLTLFEFPAVKVFAEGTGMLPIINVSAGPVVVVKDQGDVRSAAVGFELLPYEGKDDPLFSVFTLNLFNWFVGDHLIQQPNTTESLTFTDSAFNLDQAEAYLGATAQQPGEEQPILHWLAYAAIVVLSAEAILTAAKRWI
jgi:hypothetical protein